MAHLDKVSISCILLDALNLIELLPINYLNLDITLLALQKLIRL